VDGTRALQRETRTFGTTTRELLALADWLTGKAVTTWRWSPRGVLEAGVQHPGGTLEVVLVNAAHIKQVPGRKTDVKDAEWIADLLQHGVAEASFIPDRPSGTCAT